MFKPALQAFSGGQDMTTVLHQKVQIDINGLANDTFSFPVKALIKDVLLLELKKASPSTIILPINDTASDGALSMESNIPTNGEDLTASSYFGSFQDAPGNSNKHLRLLVESQQLLHAYSRIFHIL
jgi:hypothetical protein